jgi:thiamine-phosphate pyrophosphorylase
MALICFGEDMDSRTRIIDVNLNRSREGLRVLEELARFVLEDAALCARLKDLRHLLRSNDENALLAARDAAGDVGASSDLPTEMGRTGWRDLALANSKRVQESMRVLEEMAKAVPEGLLPPSAVFHRVRFESYAIESELAGRLGRAALNSRVNGLYFIADVSLAAGRDIVSITAAAIEGGARVIQLRDKESEGRDFYARALALRALCAAGDVPFIVNDRVDMAAACDADGVHLGQSDLPVSAARRILGPDKLVGVSAHTLNEAMRAQADGADHLGVGAVFATNTKSDARVNSVDALREICAAVHLPVVAIGGITAENVGQVIGAGAVSAAIISYIMNAPNVEDAARRVSREIEQAAASADRPRP